MSGRSQSRSSMECLDSRQQKKVAGPLSYPSRGRYRRGQSLAGSRQCRSPRPSTSGGETENKSNHKYLKISSYQFTKLI
ncbi:MAG: hypothetical protein ACK56I_09855, partial [bacterium]